MRVRRGRTCWLRAAGDHVGQTRSGDRGAHGESGEGNIIGFSNERRLKDIAELLSELEPEIAGADARVREILERRADLRRQRDAHLFVQDSNWAAIDHLGSSGRSQSSRMPSAGCVRPTRSSMRLKPRMNASDPSTGRRTGLGSWQNATWRSCSPTGATS
ncbi:hypothetical protein AHiyo4_21110 [Arthrobacter sp. Hiyo4]|nr:hypothetical protein AHiyo4_21110 [Arthrobacter sp. Hiyo4]